MQKEAFLWGEGAAWLDRNADKILNVDNDPVIQALDQYLIEPERVLEIGCANGWRLKYLHERFGCWIRGVDPGCIENNGTITKHTASWLPLINSCVDTVIYGWSLYLTDPEDYFRIAAEGDRVLADGGYLIIYDFNAPNPYKTPYKHKEGLFSYHYDFSKLWLSHPAYSLYGRTVQDETCVTVLKKNLEKSFPEER